MAMAITASKCRRCPRPAARMDQSALAQYGRDLTRCAENDELDPVIGRDTEITRLIQILIAARRTIPC